jgi:hypothetical protein
MMFETHHEPLLEQPVFRRRVARHGRLAFSLVATSLAIGIAGFHWLAGESWLDAYLNSAMLLGGMGPVGTIEGPLGKLFAGAYALFAGLVFLGAGAVFLVPIVHRWLHKLHLEETAHRHPRGASSTEASP